MRRGNKAGLSIHARVFETGAREIASRADQASALRHHVYRCLSSETQDDDKVPCRADPGCGGQRYHHIVWAEE